MNCFCYSVPNFGSFLFQISNSVILLNFQRNTDSILARGPKNLIKLNEYVWSSIDNLPLERCLCLVHQFHKWQWTVYLHSVQQSHNWFVVLLASQRMVCLTLFAHYHSNKTRLRCTTLHHCWKRAAAAPIEI